MTWFHDDPTLDELLGDPLTQAVMMADRVDPAELAATLRSVARQIAGRSSGSTAAPVETRSARLDRNAVALLSHPIAAFRDTACGCVFGSRIRSQWRGAP
jgi:hypothetical protein